MELRFPEIANRSPKRGRIGGAIAPYLEQELKKKTGSSSGGVDREKGGSGMGVPGGVLRCEMGVGFAGIFLNFFWGMFWEIF
jgi:hypothetical protein